MTNTTTTPQTEDLLADIAQVLDDAHGTGTAYVTALYDGTWAVDADTADGSVTVIIDNDGYGHLADAGDMTGTPLTAAALTIAVTIIAANTGTQLADRS